MRVDVDLSAGGGPPDRALRRLLFVFSRFSADVLAVELRDAAAAPGRVRRTAQVTFVAGAGLALQAEDEPGEAATEFFIDRLGRAVARRLQTRGSR